MPDYNTHRVFNYLTFLVISVLLFKLQVVITDMKLFLALGVGFYIGTDFITPDLDIESKAIKRWGRLKVIWLPYKWLFKHGQSSHNILYGAVVRIMYFSIIILGLYYLLFRSLPPETMISSVYVFIFLIGIITANALHIILDVLF
ncbi:DUF2227 family putative metal-binding protein [Candidatus Methanoperedens nitratireducens]|uniref:Metal-binding protein n=1 Tax=Candidatus Methanoperedens nitratireducens TaxID=1392998 RepID=A0A284VU72_9EURY|nr:DUF2227 family putative metal-binding protein [Candidatus Methanoperedens nitroreducens]SNQ62717.1 conserved membrane hypothetical protein [Candidatus Methanoperedens nitroreducens]